MNPLLHLSDNSTLPTILSSDCGYTEQSSFIPEGFATVPKLYGRDNEIAKLSQCLKQVCDNEHDGTPQDNSRYLVLIQGESGTGKTALATVVRDELEKEYQGLYVSGKYELYQRDEPYSGIVAACRAICGEILLLKRQDGPLAKAAAAAAENDDEVVLCSTENVAPSQAQRKRSFVEIQAILLDKLGDTIHVLLTLIPELEEVIGFEKLEENGLVKAVASRKDSDILKSQQDDHRGRLQYVFRRFLRIITSYFGPLVMVLDDLQWADIGSIELMKGIMTDASNPNFMMIGLFRSNEVLESDILIDAISSLREASRKQKAFGIVDIEIGDLDLNNVNNLVMELLSLDDIPATMDLVETVYQRTQGNTFFVLSFLRVLLDSNYLVFDSTEQSFTWDIESIRSDTMMSSNVVRMTTSKMSKLSEDLAMLLSVASCLGASFDLRHLDIIWNDLVSTRKDGTKKKTLSNLIAKAIREGFIEHFIGRSDTYRWVHDKVQEAAFGLIPVHESQPFQIQLGKILCDGLSKDNKLESSSSLYLVINLLNQADAASLEDVHEKCRMAELNLKAVRKSVAHSAFSSALYYAEKGIGFLPNPRWTPQYYKLTLNLYSSAAESASFLGKEDQVRRYCNEIFEQKDIPITEKFPANLAFVGYLISCNRFAEGKEFLLQVLARFGFKFPRTKMMQMLALGRYWFKVKALVKRVRKNGTDRLQLTEATEYLQIMHYLDRLAMGAYVTEPLLAPLAVFQGALLSEKYGLCDYVPVVFANVGLMLSALGDIEAATSIANDALGLLPRVSKKPAARTMFLPSGYILCWTQPLSVCINLSFESYHIGMSTGDVESAIYAISMYIMMQYIAGRKLGKVLKDYKRYAKQARELNRDTVANYLEPVGQSLLNLMGQSREQNTTVLQGDIIPDIGAFWERFESAPNPNDGEANNFHGFNLRLCLVFAEYEKGAKLFAAHGFDIANNFPGLCTCMDPIFSGGLCCLIMMQQHGRSSNSKHYKKLANKAYKIIKGWCNNGSPNAQHYKALFQAQRAFLQQKYEKADACFHKASSLAYRNGFLQDAAIANELYGNFLLSTQKNQNVGISCILKAVELYREWGAEKKVEEMIEQCPIELNPKRNSGYTTEQDPIWDT